MGGFDELIERLLYDVALSGSQGFDATHFEKAVRAFYHGKQSSETDQEHAPNQNLLFSDAPPAERITVDDELLTSVLDWLCRHPDVSLRQATDPGGNLQQPVNTSKLSPFAAKLAGQRIYTTEHRIWNAITGHGVDHKRVPKLEFEILSVIAAHGPGGVLQPYITKATGQDKRSVPKRTDTLAEKGYIIKDKVVAGGQKTSMLRLKRFSQDQTLSKGEHVGLHTGKVPVVRYDNWFQDTIRLLRENNNILSTRDLRLGLGMHSGQRTESRTLMRCLRRIAEVGLIRRVIARMADSNGNAMNSAASGEQRKTRAIQLLRDPNAHDRVLWMKNNASNGIPAAIGEDDSEDDAFDEADEAASSAGDLRFVEVLAPDDVEEDRVNDLDLVGNRLPPRWRAEQPIANLLQNVIEAAGEEGIGSIELGNRAVGPLWKRPMDETLSHLTDIWQHSQPPHLRHLTVVRDSAVYGKQAQHRYRTLDNFKKAVDSGAATWTAVLDNTSSKAKKDPLQEKPDLDEWGFPRISTKDLASLDGRATLADGRKHAHMENMLDYDAVDDDIGGHNEEELPAFRTPLKRKGRPRRKSRKAAADTPDNDAASQPNQRLERKTKAHPPHHTAPIGDATGEQPQAKLNTPSIDGGTAAPQEQPQEATTLVLPITGSTDKPIEFIGTASKPRYVHRRKHTQRTQADQFDVLVMRKHEIKPQEYLDYDEIAQKTAENRVRLESHAFKKRKGAALEEGLDRPPKKQRTSDFEAAGDRTDTPLDETRVAEIKARLLERNLSGVYINPPGARAMKTGLCVSRGRPRKALIAVFKFDELKDYEWFQDDDTPRLAPKAGRQRTSRNKAKSLTPDKVADSDAESETEVPEEPDVVTTQEVGPAIGGSLTVQSMPIPDTKRSSTEAIHEPSGTALHSPAISHRIFEAGVASTTPHGPTNPLNMKLQTVWATEPVRVTGFNTQPSAGAFGKFRSWKKPIAPKSQDFNVSNNVLSQPAFTSGLQGRGTTFAASSATATVAANRVEAASDCADSPDSSRSSIISPVSHGPSTGLSVTASRMNPSSSARIEDTAASIRDSGLVGPQGDGKGHNRPTPPANAPSVKEASELSLAVADPVVAMTSASPEDEATIIAPPGFGNTAQGRPSASNNMQTDLRPIRGLSQSQIASPARPDEASPDDQHVQGILKELQVFRRRPGRKTKAHLARVAELQSQLDAAAAKRRMALPVVQTGKISQVVYQDPDLAAIQDALNKIATIRRKPGRPTHIDKARLAELEQHIQTIDPTAALIKQVREDALVMLAQPRHGKQSAGWAITGQVVATEGSRAPDATNFTRELESVPDHAVSSTAAQDKQLGDESPLRQPSASQDQEVLVEPQTSTASDDVTQSIENIAVLTSESQAEASRKPTPPLVMPFKDSKARFKIDYVNAHPDETFHHCGAGSWARGLPPPGFARPTAVRGPGAADYKPPPAPARIASKASSTTLSKARRRRSSPISNSDALEVPTTRPEQHITKLPLSTPLPSTISTGDSPTHSRIPGTKEAIEARPANALAIVRPYAGDAIATSFAAVQIDDGQSHPRSNNTSFIRDAVHDSGVPDVEQDDAMAGGDDMIIDGDDQVEDENSQTSDTGHASGNNRHKGRAFSGLDGSARTLRAYKDRAKEHRHEIMMNAIRKCGGVFPGDRELWFPFCTAWKKLYGQTPEKETVDASILLLVKEGKLRRFRFQFKTRNDKVITKHIIAEPNHGINSPLVREVRQRMTRAHPLQYLPEEVDVFEDMRETATRKVQHRKGYDADGMPLNDGRRPPDAFFLDENVVVLQTVEGAEAEFEQEAFEKGFENAAAYREHLQIEDLEAKRKYGRERFKKHYEKRKSLNVSVRNDHRRDSSDDDGEDSDAGPEQLAMQSEIQIDGYVHDLKEAQKPRDGRDRTHISRYWRLPPPDAKNAPRAKRVPSTLVQSKPLGSLRRPAAKLRKKWWQNREQLRDVAESLLMSPAQSFLDTNGTFSTNGLGVNQEALDRRELRLRPGTFDGMLRGEETTHYLSQRFPDAEPDLEYASDEEFDFEDGSAVILKVPGEKLAEILALPPKPSARCAKKRGKYRSRKKRTADEALAESDGEFMPGAVSPPAGADSDIEKRPGKRAQYSVPGNEMVFRDRYSAMQFKDNDRLITAISLVSAICGGINQDRLNWGIIAHALGYRYEGEFLRRRWNQLLKTQRRFDMDKLRDAIHGPFLTAYEKGTLPKIDFQELSQTDWPALLLWVQENVPLSYTAEGNSEVPILPPSRAAVNALFKVEEPHQLFELNRDDYFATGTDQNRRHLSQRYNYGCPLPGQVKPSEHFDDVNMLLKSWMRAVALTKQRNYDSRAAARKLGVFSPQQLQQVSTELIDTHMFLQDRKGRHLPGRNFQVHHDVLVQFKRWPMVKNMDEHQYLRRTAQSWFNINEHFKQNDHLLLIPVASDHDYTVLTNMSAQGMLTLKPELPERKDDFDAPFPKLSPWGYGDAGYETKKVAQANLKFDLYYVKTSGYRYQHELRPQVPIPLMPRSVPGERGLRIPFWVDIHGNLIDDIWDMCLRSVLHVLVFRPGSKATSIENVHNHKFWAWEIILMLEWMEATGLATRCGPGEEIDGVWTGGWRAGDWWYCGFLDEMICWQPPSVEGFVAAE